MPIKAGVEDDFRFIYPTDEWQSINDIEINNWKIDSKRFYVNIEIIE